MLLHSGLSYHEITNYLWGQCCFVKKSDVARYGVRRSRGLYHKQDKSERGNCMKVIDGGTVLLERGDPCPLCGQPIQTDDMVKLLALSQIAELLGVIRIPKEAGG